MKFIFLFKYIYLFLYFTSFQAASPRWEPQIAVLCEAGQVYQPQYLSEEGRWVTDLNKKSTGATCLRDKLDLLDYCKKVSENYAISFIFFPFLSYFLRKNLYLNVAFEKLKICIF